jgi:hypothetical protein
LIIGILVAIIIVMGSYIFYQNYNFYVPTTTTTTTTTLEQTTTTSIIVKYSLSGHVTLIEGNCMPVACENPPCETTCKTSFVSRKIYIRELTFDDDVAGKYLLTPKTNLIATTTSNANGYYYIQVDKGTYSIFVEDNGKEYCGLSTGIGEMCKVELSRNTQYNILISHASY